LGVEAVGSANVEPVRRPRSDSTTARERRELVRSVHSGKPIVASPASLEQPLTDPVSASARLIQSTVELARAELRLALTRAGVLFSRAFAVVVAVAIAMPFLQVTLVLLALAPLLGSLKSPLVALLAVGIPLAVSVVAGIFLYRAASSLKRDFERLSRGE
jgi:hypothetical protein